MEYFAAFLYFCGFALVFNSLSTLSNQMGEKTSKRAVILISIFWFMVGIFSIFAVNKSK